MRLGVSLLAALLWAPSAIAQISVASNTIPDRPMVKNFSPPYPALLNLSGTGTSLSASCSGTGCTYARIQFCVAGSSPCTSTTSTPAYVGLSFGEAFHATNIYNVAPGTYPVSITLDAAEGCTGSCVVTSNLVIYAPTYPTQASPSGSMSGCVSGGSEPTYHFSPSGEKDLCTITNVRPGGTWDMPTFGNSVADPQFGAGRTFPQSGTYKRLNSSGPRFIAADAVTSQFNRDNSLVFTQTPSGTLLATKTDGSGDLYTGVPIGANIWDQNDASTFYYVKSATPDIKKVVLNGCGSPPCGSSAWTETNLYSYPGGTSAATQLTNGGGGDISVEGLFPLITMGGTDTAVVLVDMTSGTAVTKNLSYSDIPLLAPQNAAAGSGYHSIIDSISNATPPVVTTTAAHGFSTGATVFVHDSSVGAYNATWKITVIDSTHFSIPTTAAGAATGGAATRWVPRGIFGGNALSSDGRYYMILTTYPGGCSYIMSWAPGESTITVDGPQAATPSQIYGVNGIGTNPFYDGPIPSHALCDAGFCRSGFHADLLQAGGDTWLFGPYGGSVIPSVVYQTISRLRDGPSMMETPLAAGGGQISLGPVGQHDQHQSCGIHVPVCSMDNDTDSPDLTAYQVSGATNASPIVITTTSAYSGSNGDVLLINGVQGNTAANGLCTVSNLSGTTFECSGSTGNGTYTANTGSLVKNVAPAQQSYQAETWLLDFSNVNTGSVVVNRLYVHRSWRYNDRIGVNYYGQPHSTISPDGKWIAFESNGGVPDDYNVFLAPTGFIAGSSSVGPHTRRGPVTMR